MAITYDVNSQATIDRLNAANATNNPLGYQDPTETSEADETFDLFLKMLTTELANQDPLDPMDSTAFTEQLATFSSLEAQLEANASLEALVNSQDYGAQSLAVSYIGKDALAPGDELSINVEGEGAEFAYSLEYQGQSSVLEIVNDSGETVSIMEGPAYPGLNQIEWDGKDGNGDPLPAGDYKFIVKTIDVDGEEMDSEPYSYGHVRAVDVIGNDVTLILSDGREQALESVISIREDETAAL